MTTAAAPIGTSVVVDDGVNEDEEVLFPLLPLGVSVDVGSIDEEMGGKSSPAGLKVVCALAGVVEGSSVSSIGGELSTSPSLDVGVVVVGTSTGVVVTGSSPTGNVGSTPPEK